MPDQDLDRWRARVREHIRSDGREFSSDVIDELACHLAELEASALRGGYSAAGAERLASQALNAAAFLELSERRRARPPRSRDHLPALARDVRYAFRQLRRSPGFTATALLTLAIGIGANTAIFTLLHGVLLKSLPVAHAGRLYAFGDEYRCCPEENLQTNWSIFAYPFYEQIRDQTQSFEELAAMETLRPNLSVRRQGGLVAEAFTGEFVSGNYFSTLGVNAVAGRVLGSGDDRKGAAPVAVASYSAWQRYGLDASFVGQTVAINGVPVTLVGVTPPGFFGDRLESHPPDFWLPFSLEPAFTRESTLLDVPAAAWVYVIGRLRPGLEPEPVQAELTTALRDYLRVPGHINRKEDVTKVDAQVIRLAPGNAGINAMRKEYEQGLYLLLALSAAVLLTACANLANLLLARSAGRNVHTAVELAMGASRAQVLRRHLTESVVLAIAGGAAGLATAAFASRAIVLRTFGEAPHVPIATASSAPILLFTFGVSLATVALFGAAPAWLASRADPADALRGASRVVKDAALPQRSLVVFQSALLLILLTVAGLLTQSLRNLDRQPLGFETDGRVIVQIDPQSAGYTQAGLDALYVRIEDQLSRLPGVMSESLSLYTAQQNNNIWGARIFIEDGRGPWPSSWNRVGARYFETIGTPIVRGRVIDERDTADSPHVAVINETFAARYLPNQDPIGLRFGKDEPGRADDYEIIGIARDARYREPSQPVRPMFFVPLTQRTSYVGGLSNKIEESSRYVGSIELHVEGAPGAMAPVVRAALARVDPNLPPTAMTTFADLVATTTSERTLVAELSDAFGAITLLLAAVGLYGVTAYRVARRTREFGLRLALGATHRDIAGLVMRGALSQIGMGVLIGLPLALAAARALQRQLFGVSPLNVRAFLFGVVVVIGCGLAASALPARRAAKIAPTEALRM
jgi:predicted permease